jgi:hypothetical protein
MPTVILGIFFMLHALVHLLYAGQAMRFFELRPGLAWPDGAWLFARLLGDEQTRRLAAISLALGALGYLAGGLGLVLRQAWWRPTTVVAALLSALIFLLFWDGRWQDLPEKGAVGILISLVIVVGVMFLKWPA